VDSAFLNALLPFAFFAVALLYSSVGHAGATGYLALMALAGLAPEVMRPTALVLNLAVASIAVVRFARANQLPWHTLPYFLLGSIPAAYLAGSLEIPDEIYRPLLAAVLIAAALRLAVRAHSDASSERAQRRDSPQDTFWRTQSPVSPHGPHHSNSFPPHCRLVSLLPPRVD